MDNDVRRNLAGNKNVGSRIRDGRRRSERVPVFGPETPRPLRGGEPAGVALILIVLAAVGINRHKRFGHVPLLLLFVLISEVRI